MHRSSSLMVLVGGAGCAGLVGFASSPACAQSFELIPFTYQQPLGGAQGSRVEGIARDGSVIAGAVCRFGDLGCGARRPVFWTPALEMQNLPFRPEATDEIVIAPSDNAGRVAVGWAIGEGATRWLGGPGGTIDRFLQIPEGGAGGGVARDVSADGVVVVGDTWIYNEEFFAYAHGFVRLDDGPVEVLAPAPGHVHCRAYAVSADGMTVVGSSYSEADSSGFVPEIACTWSLPSLQPVTLPTLDGVPGSASMALDISSDGQVVVGSVVLRDEKLGFLRYLAVRWVREGDGWSEPQDLLPGEDCYSCMAWRVSADGGVVTGMYDRSGTFVWRVGQEPVDLGEMLTAAGVDINNWTFPEATGLSDDGRTIVGNVYKRVCECPFCGCEIFNAGFRVTLGAPCRADFNADGAANSQDFFDFLGAFFKGEARADFNADQVVNSQDFFDFLNAFFTGC